MRLLEPIIVSGVLAELSLDELVRESAIIIEGSVLEYNTGSLICTPNLPGIDSTHFRTVFTNHLIGVNAFWKTQANAVPTNIVVRTMAGIAEGMDMRVESEARLSPQEHLVLFLSKDDGNGFFTPALPPNTFTVMGGFQGKYSVYQNESQNFVARIDQPKASHESLEAFRQKIQNLNRPRPRSRSTSS